MYDIRLLYKRLYATPHRDAHSRAQSTNQLSAILQSVAHTHSLTHSTSIIFSASFDASQRSQKTQFLIASRVTTLSCRHQRLSVCYPKHTARGYGVDEANKRRDRPFSLTHGKWKQRTELLLLLFFCSLRTKSNSCVISTHYGHFVAIIEDKRTLIKLWPI